MARPPEQISGTDEISVHIETETISVDQKAGTPKGVLNGAPSIPGYQLVKIIGQGGMGVVWEAIEERFDRRVALKVLQHDVAEGPTNELWSEAYLAAKIGDPGIVRVHDIGMTLGEQPFYTMDFVDGTELAGMIADGPIAPRRAVEIAIDIARAAASAHEHGIIHCDLKPRNVLLDGNGRARILDFGIAHSSASAVSREGTIAGTPPYMAPEQAAGSAVGPATDVHAIGVLLYEMLSGQRPYRGIDQVEVLERVRTEVAAPLREMAPNVSAELAGVVARCLEKEAEHRFPSGRALAEMLVAIHEGRALPEINGGSRPTYAPKPPSNRPPAVKPKRDDAKRHFSWSWKLRSPPEKLWPWVANTDRFNRSIGMQAASFTDEMTDEGTSQRSGKTRTLGLNIQWREYPFEWVKDREHSVFRWYRGGPIEALWNRVRLAPTEEGGTELTHEIWITPRGVFGNLATSFEVGQKTRRNADKSYRHLDEVLASGTADDPFEAPHVPTTEQRELTLDAFDRLNEDGFPQAVVKRLSNHLLTAPDPVVAVMRPFPLADSWGVDRGEMLDLFLHASHLGLLEIAWDVICPKCLLAHETLDELAKVKRTGICEACVNTFERDLSKSVELVFRPNPRLRTIERATYCAGAPALRPHVLAQQTLEPGESRIVNVYLPHGSYHLSAAFAKGDAELFSSAAGYVRSCAISVRDDGLTSHPTTVLAGEIELRLTNETDAEQTVRVQLPGSRREAVIATSAVTHPTFQRFFGDELPSRGERLPVGRIAFIFVQIEDRARVFAELGDEKACEQFESLDALVREEMARNEGSEVPAALGVFVGAFPHGQLATSAALSIARAAQVRMPGLAIRLAVHEGPCVAITRVDRLEYFGETIDRGLDLLTDAPSHGIAFSSGVTDDRRVAARLYEAGILARIATSTSERYAGRRITAVTVEAVARTTFASQSLRP